MMIRIYPIRTTRQHWNIPIYNYHTCSDSGKVIQIQYDNIIMDIDNPEYDHNSKKCSNNDKLDKTFINLSEFDIYNPCGMDGPLYDPEMIVIPDRVFSLSITFPLIIGVDINIRSPTSKGLTLKELIFSIKKLYEFIYQEEERTATPVTYHLKKVCDTCDNINILDHIKEVSDLNKYNINIDSECSICYSCLCVDSEKAGHLGTDLTICELDCKHYFHKKCIGEWLLKSEHKNCPLCRKYVYTCSECNGSGFIYYDYSGTVIPMEHRGIIVNRNTTNGIFGIYGYDFEHLFLKKMIYNRMSKKLSIFIGS